MTIKEQARLELAEEAWREAALKAADAYRRAIMAVYYEEHDPDADDFDDAAYDAAYDATYDGSEEIYDAIYNAYKIIYAAAP